MSFFLSVVSWILSGFWPSLFPSFSQKAGLYFPSVRANRWEDREKYSKGHLPHCLGTTAPPIKWEELPLLLNVRLLPPPLPPPLDCLGAGCERMETMEKPENRIFHSILVLGDLFPVPLARTGGFLLLRSLSC